MNEIEEDDEENEEDYEEEMAATDPGEQQDKIQAKVKDNVAVLAENLNQFKDAFDAKKTCKKIEKEIQSSRYCC